MLAKPSRVRGLFKDRFGETPKPTRETRALPKQPALVRIAFHRSPFTIHFSQSGGIAQLVERQLCKLEVRGSNPLASNFWRDTRRRVPNTWAPTETPSSRTGIARETRAIPSERPPPIPLQQQITADRVAALGPSYRLGRSQNVDCAWPGETGICPSPCFDYLRLSLSSFFQLLFALAATDSPPPNNKPQYGAWGFDLAGADTKTKPGDDFFRYANGTWIDKTQIPPDKPAYSLRLAMTDLTEQRLHEMMETLAAKDVTNPSTLEDKVAAFYRSFMDEARIEQLGAKPIESVLSEVKKAETRDDLAALMGRESLDYESALFSYGIDVDLKDPSKYAFYLRQSGLGLPDRDYYLKPEFEKKKSAYRTYVTTLLKLVAWPEAEARAKDVVDFETRIADASWTKAEQRNLDAIYNPMTVDELAKFTPGFNWKGFLGATKMDNLSRVIIAEKSAFPKLADIYAKTPLETIRAWHAFHIADNAAPYLSKAFTAAYFELHGKTLSGQKEQQARWKRAITTVGGGDFGVGDRFGTFGTMGFGVGQLFSAKYFPPEAKAKIQELVANLIAAYRARIQKLDWMDDKTKEQALQKLDTYTIKVGYPDHTRDYSKLVVRKDDLIGNVRRAAEAGLGFL